MSGAWRRFRQMSSRRIIIAALVGIVGVAILVSLGLWQVQRLGQKEALIARIESRLAASPVPLPAHPDPEEDALLHVTARGKIGERELHVLGSLRPWGPGYRIISPFILDDGRRVLLDLGCVPEDLKEPAARPARKRSGQVDVTGVLLWPRETDGFTPDPDLERNIWFAREVDSMAEALETEPVLIVAEENVLGEWPLAVPPGVDLPNRHLEYAATWFGVALAWGGMTLFWIYSELRRRR